MDRIRLYLFQASMKEIILSVIMIFGLGGFKSMRPDVISDFIIKIII